MQRLWVSGYRSYELSIFNNKDKRVEVIKYALKNRLQRLLDDGQLDWIITGPNLGIEQWSVEVGLELSQDYQLRIAMIAPYANFSQHWNESNQLHYQELKDRVDFYASVSNQPYQSPQQLKNYQQFMFEHTDQALLVYDTECPGKPRYDYDFIKNGQKNKAFDLQLIDFYDLQDAAQDYLEENSKDF
ncbi:putative phage-like protein YoqJ [Lactobacillus colini]|uniref:UPF0398 protein J2Z60_000249 n=1 Tax=Lactobacillus colini TaxID=1819254 RepID=A0ABS4MBN2_9LACO|nr:DUF1273 domain-containing protein [Lactobacillus colini]MBP2057087.1 putative phage-like protein YoqJ [Lactobacillus colini]